MPARVAVVPPAAFHARPRLLGALAQALPVRFEPRAPGQWRDVAAVVRIGAAAAAAPPPLPCLDAQADEPPVRPGAAAATVRLAARDEELDARLHDAALTDAPVAATAALAATEPAALVAARGGEPLWLRSAGGRERVAVAPRELDDGEMLRSRLEPGRCLALLALVHFLRRAAQAELFDAPPLRAAFILDDPNLHWPTYGHVRYSDLARDAAAYRYHVAIATVPLDTWFVHPRVRRIFLGSARQLSLLVHGHLHDGPELGRVSDESSAARIGAAALRRVAALERRSGLGVSRVMAPPHERLSEPAAHGLLACGFDGVTMSRPHPWLSGGWLAAPPDAGPLVGWGVAEQIVGGLPVLLRSALSHPREDLVLRAFLGQPLILYGHARDLAGGTEALRTAAQQINRLGSVHWTSLGDMLASSAETRVDGSRLVVRMHARRVRVDVPPGIDHIALTHAGDACAPRMLGVEHPGTVELALPAPAPRPAAAPAPGGAAWPVLRRLASEARDRVAPLAAGRVRAPRRPHPA